MGVGFTTPNHEARTPLPIRPVLRLRLPSVLPPLLGIRVLTVDRGDTRPERPRAPGGTTASLFLRVVGDRKHRVTPCVAPRDRKNRVPARPSPPATAVGPRDRQYSVPPRPHLAPAPSKPTERNRSRRAPSASRRRPRPRPSGRRVEDEQSNTHRLSSFNLRGLSRTNVLSKRVNLLQNRHRLIRSNFLRNLERPRCIHERL